MPTSISLGAVLLAYAGLLAYSWRQLRAGGSGTKPPAAQPVRSLGATMFFSGFFVLVAAVVLRSQVLGLLGLLAFGAGELFVLFGEPLFRRFDQCLWTSTRRRSGRRGGVK